jgi:hypothetical protein
MATGVDRDVKWRTSQPARRRSFSRHAVVVEGGADQAVLREPVELQTDPLGGIGEVEVPAAGADVHRELVHGCRQAGPLQHPSEPPLPVVRRRLVTGHSLGHKPPDAQRSPATPVIQSVDARGQVLQPEEAPPQCLIHHPLRGVDVHERPGNRRHRDPSVHRDVVAFRPVVDHAVEGSAPAAGRAEVNPLAGRHRQSPQSRRGGMRRRARRTHRQHHREHRLLP